MQTMSYSLNFFPRCDNILFANTLPFTTLSSLRNFSEHVVKIIPSFLTTHKNIFILDVLGCRLSQNCDLSYAMLNYVVLKENVLYFKLL